MADQDFWSGFVFSRPPATRRVTSAVSLGIAVLAHVLVFAGAVWLTRPHAGVEAEVEEQITLIQLEVEPPPAVEAPPPAAAPPVAAPPVAAANEVVPQGFQTLAKPDLSATEIPPPATVATNEADFSGVGVVGGRAAGDPVTVADTTPAVVTPAAPVEESGPRLAAMTTTPRLKNENAVRMALEQHSRALRNSGKSGTAVVWLLLDEKGKVVETQLRTSSGDADLDARALRVAEVMSFTPAKNGEHTIRAWIYVPIVFQLR